MAPDDFAVGVYCTVLEWQPREVEEFPSLFGGGFSDPWKAPQTRIVKDRSDVGRVLRIEAVDLPFVAVSRPGDSMLRQPTMLDTRQCTLKRLSADMVRALLGSREEP